MSHILDIDSFEGSISRTVKKRTPANTNPLSLDASERKIIKNVADEIDRNLKIKSLSTYNQMLTFHAAINGMEAALAGDWAALASSAEAGLSASFEVQNVTPYLICKQDEAKRNLASDQRAALKELALRLGHAAPAKTPIDEARARCLRAMTYAAIAADRGLMHLVKDNFGAVLVTIGRDDFAPRKSLIWTDNMANFALRYRNARVQMP